MAAGTSGSSGGSGGTSVGGETGSTGGVDDTGTGSTGAEPVPLPEGFEPVDCDTQSPDVSVDRLCEEAADPEAHEDPVYISCGIEASCLPASPPPPKDSLVVMTYNIERGMSIDAQLAEFGDAIPIPDVLLLVEADRGCARSGGGNVAWQYAEALEMGHVFGVEFIELPRPGDAIPELCEHGNAVLSRYPIGNVRQLRHETNLSWYDSEEEPRLGGRVAVLADIAVGDEILHVQVMHFESGVDDGPIRAAQAAELADLGLEEPNPVVIGGDANSGLYVIDLLMDTHNDGTTEAFFERGYVDAHAELPLEMRATHSPGLILDLLMLEGTTATEPAICPPAQCGQLSDHLPVWATIAL